ncbi:protoporphyrinogen oxidase [Cohnella panacarvi]|uniref:protoporphyrinogen oxidase n=1 Tax=Cohnella panacarvi TaxID=400776 RepID=UPI000479588D|nr:protoporphyrinogen oxidase [Cohnella panacarvi]
MTADKRIRIVIAGGGITGLSAAFYLTKQCANSRIPVDITIVEKSERLGGKIRTLHRDGFVIEKGPDSFLARKLPIINLVKDLGLEDQLTGTNPNAKTNYILHRGKLHAMPLGLVLGIPTAVTPFMKTGLISPLGKLRAAMDLLLPRRGADEDESLGGFIRRRLGQEVLEHITEPLLAGIYAGDTQSLSLAATFPQFKQIERKHRSLILGMLAAKKDTPKLDGLPEIARRSLFLTFKQGLSTLVDKLEQSLPGVRIVTGQGIERLTNDGGGYVLKLTDGTDLEADGLIMALPSYEAARLLTDVPGAEALEQVSYASVANIALAYNQEEIGRSHAGSGFVVPRKEGRFITACTWTSSKWLHAAPKGKVLLRTYVGRSNDQDWLRLSEKQLIEGVRADLKETMGITAEPEFVEISRCLRSMPQYPVGHRERLARLNERLKLLKPGIWLCGAGYEGVGIPDCVQQGKTAAERLIHYFVE